MFGDLLLSHLAAGILLVANPVPVTCPNEPIDVELVQVLNKLERDSSLNAVDIGAPSSWGIDVLVPHLATKTEFTIQPTFQIVPTQGDNCVYVEKLLIVYKVKPTLALSSVYPEGSCEAQQVQIHAQKHVDVLEQFFEQAKPVVERSVPKLLQGAKSMPMGKKQRDEVEAILKKKIEDEFYNYANYMDTQHENIQEQMLDSDAEMVKTHSICPMWAERLKKK